MNLKIFTVIINLIAGNIVLFKYFPMQDESVIYRGGVYTAFNLIALAVLFVSWKYLKSVGGSFLFLKCLSLGIAGSFLIALLGLETSFIAVNIKNDPQRSLLLVLFSSSVVTFLALIPAALFWGSLGILNGFLFYLIKRYA
ncbi:MAG: hypothetical protein Q7R35_15680, partial [Elusimicrobiota bacterium]|nr:hypothetical protein [Elusimicrobiota bacterium]